MRVSNLWTVCTHCLHSQFAGLAHIGETFAGTGTIKPAGQVAEGLAIARAGTASNMAAGAYILTAIDLVAQTDRRIVFMQFLG